MWPMGSNSNCNQKEPYNHCNICHTKMYNSYREGSTIWQNIKLLVTYVIFRRMHYNIDSLVFVTHHKATSKVPLPFWHEQTCYINCPSPPWTTQSWHRSPARWLSYRASWPPGPPGHRSGCCRSEGGLHQSAQTQRGSPRQTGLLNT